MAPEEGEILLVSASSDTVEWLVLTPGMTLPNGSWVRTGNSGRVILRRGDEMVQFRPSTTASITSWEHEGATLTDIEQRIGTLLLEVETRDTKHTIVETPLAAAVVKGTGFTVVYDGEKASVEVDHGIVEVLDLTRNESVDVHADQSVEVSRSRPGSMILQGPGSKDVVRPIAFRATGAPSRLRNTSQEADSQIAATIDTEAKVEEVVDPTIPIVSNDIPTFLQAAALQDRRIARRAALQEERRANRIDTRVLERRTARQADRRASRVDERQAERRAARVEQRQDERQLARIEERRSERQAARIEERQTERVEERQTARAAERQAARVAERQAERAGEFELGKAALPAQGESGAALSADGETGSYDGSGDASENTNSEVAEPAAPDGSEPAPVSNITDPASGIAVDGATDTAGSDAPASDADRTSDRVMTTDERRSQRVAERRAERQAERREGAVVERALEAWVAGDGSADAAPTAAAVPEEAETAVLAASKVDRGGSASIDPHRFETFATGDEMPSSVADGMPTLEGVEPEQAAQRTLSDDMAGSMLMQVPEPVVVLSARDMADMLSAVLDTLPIEEEPLLAGAVESSSNLDAKETMKSPSAEFAPNAAQLTSEGPDDGTAMIGATDGPAERPATAAEIRAAERQAERAAARQAERAAARRAERAAARQGERDMSRGSDNDTGSSADDGLGIVEPVSMDRSSNSEILADLIDLTDGAGVYPSADADGGIGDLGVAVAAGPFSSTDQLERDRILVSSPQATALAPVPLPTSALLLMTSLIGSFVLGFARQRRNR